MQSKFALTEITEKQLAIADKGNSSKIADIKR